MEVKAFRDEASYYAALARVSALIDLDPESDSPDGEALEVLGALVEVYEAKHYPIAPPNPIDAIKFHMEHVEHKAG